MKNCTCRITIFSYTNIVKLKIQSKNSFSGSIVIGMEEKLRRTVIGLTGPSGAGKGMVGKIFEENGIPCIDTDLVYRKLLIPPSECLDELCGYFGNGITDDNGTLDRRKLAKVVFGKGNEKKLAVLNSISHRHILNKVRETIKEYNNTGFSVVAVDAPLLFESGFDSECDLIVSVMAPYNERLSRIILRDGISEDAAKMRLSAQHGDEYYTERSDYIINNDCDTERLMLQTLIIIKDILKQAENKV